jgi:hypothetical protein
VWQGHWPWQGQRQGHERSASNTTCASRGSAACVCGRPAYGMSCVRCVWRVAEAKTPSTRTQSQLVAQRVCVAAGRHVTLTLRACAALAPPPCVAHLSCVQVVMAQQPQLVVAAQPQFVVAAQPQYVVATPQMAAPVPVVAAAPTVAPRIQYVPVPVSGVRPAGHALRGVHVRVQHCGTARPGAPILVPRDACRCPHPCLSQCLSPCQRVWRKRPRPRPQPRARAATSRSPSARAADCAGRSARVCTGRAVLAHLCNDAAEAHVRGPEVCLQHSPLTCACCIVPAPQRLAQAAANPTRTQRSAVVGAGGTTTQ